MKEAAALQCFIVIVYKTVYNINYFDVIFYFYFFKEVRHEQELCINGSY